MQSFISKDAHVFNHKCIIRFFPIVNVLQIFTIYSHTLFFGSLKPEPVAVIQYVNKSNLCDCFVDKCLNHLASSGGRNVQSCIAGTVDSDLSSLCGWQGMKWSLSVTETYSELSSSCLLGPFTHVCAESNLLRTTVS